jgi:hypothetical protein
MGRTRELASAFVRLFVKKDELSAGLNSAKAEVGQATEQMAQSAGKVSTGFGGVAASIKSATKPARDLVGSITSTLGIFTRILGIVGLIGGAVGALVVAWKQIAEYGERQAKALQGVIALQREAASEARKASEDNKTKTLEELQSGLKIEDAYKRRAKLQTMVNKETGRVPIAFEKEFESLNRQIDQYENLVDLIETSAQKKKDEAAAAAATADAEKLKNFEKLVRDEAAAERRVANGTEQDAKQREEAARDAARQLLEDEAEVLKILDDADKIRAKNHENEMRRIEERAAAELRAINDARNQTLSAINAAQNALGQNNLAVAHLARIDRLVRMILERPIEKRL